MPRQSKDKNHFVRFGKGGEGRFSIDIKLSIVSIVVDLLAVTALLFRGFDPQTDYLSDFIDKNANLVAELVPHEFAAFDAYMLLAIKINGNIVSRKAYWTTT